MKRKDFTEIKVLDIKSLQAKAEELKKEISQLILDRNMNKLKDKKMILKRKKDVAQIFTVLKQKQLLGELESKINKKGEEV